MTDEWERRLHPDGAPGDAEYEARKLLGDRNYENIRDTSKRNQELLFADTIAHTDLVRARATLVTALGFLVSVATLLGVAWSIWAWT